MGADVWRLAGKIKEKVLAIADSAELDPVTDQKLQHQIAGVLIEEGVISALEVTETDETPKRRGRPPKIKEGEA